MLGQSALQQQTVPAATMPLSNGFMGAFGSTTLPVQGPTSWSPLGSTLHQQKQVQQQAAYGPIGSQALYSGLNGPLGVGGFADQVAASMLPLGLESYTSAFLGIHHQQQQMQQQQAAMMYEGAMQMPAKFRASADPWLVAAPTAPGAIPGGSPMAPPLALLPPQQPQHGGLWGLFRQSSGPGMSSVSEATLPPEIGLQIREFLL